MKKPWIDIVFFFSCLSVLLVFNWSAKICSANAGEQALAQIAMHKTTFALSDSASIRAHPNLLGTLEADTDWVTVNLRNSNPAEDDWVGVFSPAKFNESLCYPILEDSYEESPYICTSPIKYQFANYSNPDYTKTGQTTSKFQLINQRNDISFAFFAGGLSNASIMTSVLQYFELLTSILDHLVANV